MTQHLILLIPWVKSFRNQELGREEDSETHGDSETKELIFEVDTLTSCHLSAKILQAGYGGTPQCYAAWEFEAVVDAPPPLSLADFHLPTQKRVTFLVRVLAERSSLPLACW